MAKMIDGEAYKEMILQAAEAVAERVEEVNALNVFPVPDGDTGTNMSMTLNNAADALNKLESPTLGRALEVTSSALLRGARGNSGVITSLLFRGIAKGMKDARTADGATLAEGLREGSATAYKAVMKPAEGTILTVSRIAGDAAVKAAKKTRDPEAVLGAAIKAAKKALEETTNQNPVLKKAGVVDAGAYGYLLILQGMQDALSGTITRLARKIPVPVINPAMPVESADFSAFDEEEINFDYCTEFICARENPKDPDDLRQFLPTIGDCVVVVEDDEIIKVHVHTNDPGRALHEAVEYGSFVTVKVENMRLQHTEKVMSEKELAPKIAEPEKPIGVVSVCAGAGLADVFTNLGVDAIISGGQTMNPSTQDILEAVNRVGAETVFVLPNNKNIIMAAQQVDALTPKNVVVISSKTVPQGVTAMLSFNPEGTVEENTQAMTEALPTVDTMQITYAARNSDFDGYDIHQGDYLAMYGSALFGTSQDIKVLLRSLAEKVRDEGKEYITIYYGCDIKEKHAQKAADLFADICPEAEISLINGGQPVYYYLISAE